MRKTLAIVAEATDIRIRQSLDAFNRSSGTSLEANFLPTAPSQLEQRLQDDSPMALMIGTKDAVACRLAVQYCLDRNLRCSVINTGINDDLLIPWLNNRKIEVWEYGLLTSFRGALAEATSSGRKQRTAPPARRMPSPQPARYKPSPRWDRSNGNAEHSAKVFND